MNELYPLAVIAGSFLMVTGQLTAAWVRRALIGITAGWAWWTTTVGQPPEAAVRAAFFLLIALGIPVIWLIRYFPDEQQAPPWRRNSETMDAR